MSALATWMELANETDESLAPKVGVSRVQVRRLRLGENKASPKTALRLQEITAIPAAKFIFGEAAS